MLIVLSPAKRLDFQTPAHIEQHTQPRYLAHSRQLIALLKKMDLRQVATLMSISDPLAARNVARYANWKPPFTERNAKQAVLAFDGDVYDGLDAPTLDAAALAWAQRLLRILSGLYGILQPLDLIQPYRLEMGTRLASRRGADLYSFWGDRLARALDSELDSQRTPVLIHLASAEYFQAVRSHLRARVIQPVFQEARPEGWKVMAFCAKRARGRMARFAIDHRIDQPGHLKEFDADGYRFDPVVSSEATWVFRRSAGAAAHTIDGSGSRSTPNR